MLFLLFPSAEYFVLLQQLTGLGTIGAFFAIYWLMRLRCDGKEGFSFGVDKDWAPPLMATCRIDFGDQNWDFSCFFAVSGLSHDHLIYPRKEWHSRIKAHVSARSGIFATGPVVEIPSF